MKHLHTDGKILKMEKYRYKLVNHVLAIPDKCKNEDFFFFHSNKYLLSSFYVLALFWALVIYHMHKTDTDTYPHEDYIEVSHYHMQTFSCQLN